MPTQTSIPIGNLGKYRQVFLFSWSLWGLGCVCSKGEWGLFFVVFYILGHLRDRENITNMCLKCTFKCVMKFNLCTFAIERMTEMNAIFSCFQLYLQWHFVAYCWSHLWTLGMESKQPAKMLPLCIELFRSCIVNLFSSD